MISMVRRSWAVGRSTSMAALAAALFLLPGCNNGDTACDSDRDCSALGGVCDFSTGVCVQCNTDVDCLSDTQVCRENVCTAVTFCTSSRECPGLVCDTGLGYCVECLEDIDCPSGELCDSQRTCQPAPTPCTSDRQCSPMGLVCDTIIERCVECVREADCPTGFFCSVGECVR